MDFVEGCKRLARNDHEFYQWAYAAGHQHLTIEDFLLDLARKLEDDDCERQSSATRFGVRNVQDDERRDQEYMEERYGLRPLEMTPERVKLFNELMGRAKPYSGHDS